MHDEAGITRDRTYRTGMWNNYNFQIIDTGGIVFDDAKDTFADRITEQVCSYNICVSKIYRKDNFTFAPVHSGNSVLLFFLLTVSISPYNYPSSTFLNYPSGTFGVG